MSDDILTTIRAEYVDLAHAMQSGVAMEIGLNGGAASPKHLRVGINSAMSDASGLAKLLMDKGVITELEYYRAVRDAMKREVVRYEAHLSTLMGTQVRLL